MISIRLSLIKCLYLLCFSSALLTLSWFFNYFSGSSYVHHYWAQYSDKSSTCQIPRVDPFQPEAMDLLKNPPGTERDLCGNQVPLLFESPPSLESLIVPAVSKEDFVRMGIDSCCYRVVTAAPYNRYRLSDTCIPLSLNRANKVPPDIEFAAVYCSLFTKSPKFKYPHFEDKPVNTSILVDVHLFVNMKPEVEERLRSESLPPSEDRLNVLIIGTDAVARNNMIRTMPQTFKFLMEDLEAVDMKGYNKIGYNTFPCMVPLYFSMDEEEVLSTCALNLRFDSCPFIWDNFAEKGYRTSYHEDMPAMSTFISNDDSKRGFKVSPADYYNQGPMLLAFNETAQGWNYVCHGPRLSNTVLLDYTKKFVMRMDSLGKSYFHFLWTAGLTHDHLEYAIAQDQPLSSLLQWLRDGGHLNNTALILLSDHGLNFVSQGGTGLGRFSLETHLPYMFLVLPQSFKRKYPEAYQNLQKNSDYRLTTTFDLHQTLLDILEPTERLQRDKLLQRELELKEQELNNSLPRGISHFLPIPESRTCNDAKISSRHCVCLGTWEDVPINLDEISEGAEFAVGEINGLLLGSANCSNLTLSKVISAKTNSVGGHKLGMKTEEGGSVKVSFLLEIETEPGAAQFEVQIFMDPENDLTKWEVMRQISRLDRYSVKGHGHCVKGSSIEKFCYCT